LRFPQVSFDEFGITPDRFVAVLNCRGERKQLDEGGGAIAVASRVIRRAFREFGICFDCFGLF